MRDFFTPVTIVRNSYLRSNTLFGTLQSLTRTFLFLGLLLSIDSAPAWYSILFSSIAIGLYYLIFLPSTSPILEKDQSFPIPLRKSPRLLGLLSSVRGWEVAGPLAVHALAGNRILSSPVLLRMATFFIIAILLRWAVDSLLSKGALDRSYVIIPTAACALIPVVTLWSSETIVQSAAILPLSSIAIGPIMVTWGQMVTNLSKNGNWQLLAAFPGACAHNFRLLIARNSATAFIGIFGAMTILEFSSLHAVLTATWSAVLILLASRLFLVPKYLLTLLVLLLVMTTVSVVFQIFVLAAENSQIFATAHAWLAMTGLMLSLLAILHVKDFQIVSRLIRSP